MLLRCMSWAWAWGKNCMLAYFTLDLSMMSGRHMQSTRVWRRGSFFAGPVEICPGGAKACCRVMVACGDEGAEPYTGGALWFALCRAAELELGTCGFIALEPIFFKPMRYGFWDLRFWDFEFELGLIYCWWYCIVYIIVLCMIDRWLIVYENVEIVYFEITMLLCNCNAFNCGLNS